MDQRKQAGGVVSVEFPIKRRVMAGCGCSYCQFLRGPEAAADFTMRCEAAELRERQARVNAEQWLDVADARETHQVPRGTDEGWQDRIAERHRFGRRGERRRGIDREGSFWPIVFSVTVVIVLLYLYVASCGMTLGAGCTP